MATPTPLYTSTDRHTDTKNNHRQEEEEEEEEEEEDRVVERNRHAQKILRSLALPLSINRKTRGKTNRRRKRSPINNKFDRKTNKGNK